MAPSDDPSRFDLPPDAGPEDFIAPSDPVQTHPAGPQPRPSGFRRVFSWAPAWLADVEALLARDFTPITDHRGGAAYRLRAALFQL